VVHAGRDAATHVGISLDARRHFRVHLGSAGVLDGGNAVLQEGVWAHLELAWDGNGTVELRANGSQVLRRTGLGRGGREVKERTVGRAMDGVLDAATLSMAFAEPHPNSAQSARTGRTKERDVGVVVGGCLVDAEGGRQLAVDDAGRLSMDVDEVSLWSGGERGEGDVWMFSAPLQGPEHAWSFDGVVVGQIRADERRQNSGGWTMTAHGGGEVFGVVGGAPIDGEVLVALGMPVVFRVNVSSSYPDEKRAFRIRVDVLPQFGALQAVDINVLAGQDVERTLAWLRDASSSPSQPSTTRRRVRLAEQLIALQADTRAAPSTPLSQGVELDVVDGGVWLQYHAQRRGDGDMMWIRVLDVAAGVWGDPASVRFRLVDREAAQPVLQHGDALKGRSAFSFTGPILDDADVVLEP
jgi:hypothetical protein